MVHAELLVLPGSRSTWVTLTWAIETGASVLETCLQARKWRSMQFNRLATSHLDVPVSSIPMALLRSCSDTRGIVVPRLMTVSLWFCLIMQTIQNIPCNLYQRFSRVNGARAIRAFCDFIEAWDLRDTIEKMWMRVMFLHDYTTLQHKIQKCMYNKSKKKSRVKTLRF